MEKKLKSYRFDARSLQIIDELKDSLHLESNSAVIRKAIVLLKIVTDAQENDGKLIVRGPEGEKEIVLC